MMHHVGNTRNGTAVHVDLIGSPAAKHIAIQPRLLTLVKEALLSLSTRGLKAVVECDLGRPVGYSAIVSTSSDDAIFYAQTLHEQVYTRFVKNSKPVATNYISLRLKKVDDTYILHDVWIGQAAPPRPGEEDEMDESKTFWTNYAYVYTSQPLKMRSATKTSPY